jgi:hypothetical protein
MLFLANIFGWFVAHVRLFAVLIAIFLVVFGTALLWKRCNPPPKLDEKGIQKGQIAVEQHNNEILKQVLAESDTRERNIDANIKQAEENTRQAAKSYDGWTDEQLAEEFEKRKSQ